MEQIEQVEKTTVIVCDIQFRTGTKVYFFDPGDLTVKAGDDVIIETARGPEYGQCVRGNHEVSHREVVQPLRPVIRIATSQDKRIDEENRVKEKRAYDICLNKIEDLKLEMQLVSVEYAFDGSKILFFFTADGRVDFRELVKSLASVLRTRIELRQIGVRDKAKMVGGLGICGRPFCCREFLEDFQPVSIKMAKTQNLSLNPTKISGTCGRLMCCLNYEQEAYEDLLRTSPKAESFVDTPDGRGTVTDVNLLKQTVHVRLEKQPDTVVCHNNCDICVLRSGKAKKTDPPIPEDLAPISGNRPKKSEQSSFTTYLDPVVIRGETIPGTDTDSNAAEEEGRKRRRRGGRNHKKPEGEAQPSGDAPKTEAPKKDKSPRADAPKSGAPRADAPKKDGRKPQSKKPQQPKTQKKDGQAPKKEAQPSAPGAARKDGDKPRNNHYHHRRRKPAGPKTEG